jgi:hypothetical protein
MTKKHFLLLIALLLAIQNLSSKGVTFHIYQNCNGIRTHLGTANTNPDFIATFTGCINICSDCDLEISHETISGVPLNISNNPNKLSDPNFQYFDLIFGWGNAERTLIEETIDGNKKTIVRFNLSEIKTSVNFGWMYIDGCRINFNCLKIDHSNNKDGINIADKEICLGDCFYLRDLIKNNDMIDPLTGNTVMKANPDKDWIKIGDEYIYRGFEASVLEKLYCPTKPGKFEIKTTVKDACGEKEISGFLTVKDCTPFNNCEQCCGNFLNFANEMRSKGLPPLKQVGSLYINEYEESFFKCEYSISLLIECQGGNSNNILLKPNDSYMLPPGCKIKGYCIIPKDRCIECEMCFDL